MHRLLWSQCILGISHHGPFTSKWKKSIGIIGKYLIVFFCFCFFFGGGGVVFY